MLKPNLFRAGSCRCDNHRDKNNGVANSWFTLSQISSEFASLRPSEMLCMFFCLTFLSLFSSMHALIQMWTFITVCAAKDVFLIYASSNVKITALRAHFCLLSQTAGCSVFHIAHTLPASWSILVKLTRSHFTFIHIILMYNYLLSINPQCMTIIISSAIGSVTRDFASSSCFVWSLNCRANFHIPWRKNC